MVKIVYEDPQQSGQPVSMQVNGTAPELLQAMARIAGELDRVSNISVEGIAFAILMWAKQEAASGTETLLVDLSRPARKDGGA